MSALNKKINCIFVVSKQFERNLKLNFHDKEPFAMGSNSERVAHPVSDCLDNPKAAAPHTKLFSMSKENQFVNSSAYATFTALKHQHTNILKQSFKTPADKFACVLQNLTAQFNVLHTLTFKTAIL